MVKIGPRPHWCRPVAVLLCAASLSACTGGASPQAGSSRPAPPVSGFGGVPSIIPTTGPPPAPSPSFPKCKFPARKPLPGWIPDDLPLPGGTYLSQNLSGSLGYTRGIFVVPGGLTQLARFVLTEWPKHGWILGRGDAEPGEVEDQFSRPPAVGAFKAQAQYCEPGYNLMLLIYVKDRTKVGPQPGTQGGSPIPGASVSPLPSGSRSPLVPSASPSR